MSHASRLYVLRRRMEYPDLKRAVREQSGFHKADVVFYDTVVLGRR